MANETPPEPLTEILRAMGDTLRASPSRDESLPQLVKLTEQLGALSAASEDLHRYRETRKRMGARPESFIAPPNFAYTIRSS